MRAARCLPTRSVSRSSTRAEVAVGVGHPPQHVVGGVQQHRGVERLAQFGGDGDVVVVAVGAHHRDHVPAADGVDDRLRGVGGVEHHHIVVVADDPDVVVDVPTAAVELEGAAGDQALDRAGRSQDHHRTQDLTGVHLVEGVLDVVEPDAFGDELVQREPALQIQADQRREVTLGQAVAVPARTSATRRGRRSRSAASPASCPGVGTPTRTTVPARSRA